VLLQKRRIVLFNTSSFRGISTKVSGLSGTYRLTVESKKKTDIIFDITVISVKPPFLVTFGFSPNIPLQESLVAYKIPSFASAKTSARATPSRIFHLIRRIFTHVFFSSESTVPRAFADRFVRVKSIYYLVPGIFLFVETLWMVCCIVSVWKI
jgi:hypothetical protein